MDENLKYQIIRMDNALATKSTQMNATYQKLFYLSLASIKPNQTSNEVVLSKKEVFDLMGYKNKADYTSIRYRFQQLMMKSFFKFEDDDGNWNDGFLISGVRTTKKEIIVEFRQYYMPLLTHLSKNYTRLLNDDVIDFNSKFSMMLYQFLMRYNDNVKTLKPITLTTRELKKLFGLNDDDYCRKNGKFDRANFEKKTLDVAIQEISEKSKCIVGLSYKKHYKNRLVSCYEFNYSTIDPQKVVNDIKTKEFLEEHQTTLEDYGVEVEVEQNRSNFKWWEE